MTEPLSTSEDRQDDARLILYELVKAERFGDRAEWAKEQRTGRRG